MRSLACMDWPALADTLPGFDASPRLFVLAPAGTPDDVILKLNAVLGARMSEEARRWSQIAKDAGIKTE